MQIGTRQYVFDLRPINVFWGRYRKLYLMLDNPDSSLANSPCDLLKQGIPKIVNVGSSVTVGHFK